MYWVILDKIDYEPKLIIRDIDDRFQYKISYAKAWQAKQKVFEMRFGTYEASYDNLLKVIGCSSLRGGGGELGTNKNLDIWLQLVCRKLKLKHAI